MKNVLLFCFAMLAANLSSALDLYSCGDDILNEQQAKEKSCSFLVSTDAIATSWDILTMTDTMVCHKHKTIQRGQNGLRRIWVLCSFGNPKRLRSGAEYFSFKSLDHFDCKNNRTATQRVIFYSGRLGAGSPVNQDIDTEQKDLKFEEPIPDTVGETMLRNACK